MKVCRVRRGGRVVWSVRHFCMMIVSYDKNFQGKCVLPENVLGCGTRGSRVDNTMAYDRGSGVESKAAYVAPTYQNLR